MGFTYDPALGDGASFGGEATDLTDLIVQASFRGVIVGHTTLRHRHRALRRVRYRIGASPGAAPAPADKMEGASFVLVEDTPQGLRVNLLPAMRGNASVGALQIPLATWQLHHGASFVLPAEAGLHLVCGQMEYLIHWAAPPPPVRAPLVRLRWSEQRYTAGTGLFFLLAVLLTSLLPPDARALSLQRWTRDYRLIAFSLVPLEEQERARQESARSRLPGTPPATRADARKPGLHARAPHRDATSNNARPDTLPRGGAVGPAEPDSSARLAAVRNSGILGLLRPDGGTSAVAAIFSRDSSLGDDPQAVLGHLDQFRFADSYDIGGLPLVDGGASNAGTGERTIGVGRLGTISVGQMDLSGHDHAGAIGRLAARRPRALDVVAEPPAVRGGLDKEIVRRIVRRHINEIRYCYEQELPRAPTLSGRLAVRFTIAASGAVAAAMLESTSLANPRVEMCAVAAVRRWAFPQPQGGGIVIATYPFTFVPAGQSP